MRQRPIDDNVVDALAVAFRGKNLRVQHQSPKIRMHRFLLIFGRLTLGLDGIGIRHRYLKACATWQDKEARHASGDTPQLDVFADIEGHHSCGNH